MLEDGDTVLNLVGGGLVLAVLLGLAVVGLNFGTAPSSDAAPDANWSVERVNDTHVAITHAGGEPVRTEHLVVTVDSLPRTANWTDPVAPGDSGVVRAESGAKVRVFWDRERGERHRMASWRV